jgi:1-acyl-sn-glycerol-3-phosphate acyltransferase
METNWVRRPVTITLWLVVAVAFVVLSPLLLGVAWIADKLARRPQPLIAVRLIVAYFASGIVALTACGVLWLFSGGGWLMQTRRFQLLHWRLLRWFARRIASIALSAFEIDVAPDSSPDAARALEDDAPVIVFSRHAGPGDTFLLLDQLLSHFHRRPSVVLKGTWALEPCVDLLAHRLPQALLESDDRDECIAVIAEVTAALGRRGALLLFPEGGNFTPERRRSALAKLRDKGRRRAAAEAEQMSNVLPPRPTGALAAIGANPDADVIFAGHTGLGLAAYPAELWRDMPIGRTLRTHMWLVPSSDVPADSDEQVAWLNDWWQRIDTWIEEQQ